MSKNDHKDLVRHEDLVRMVMSDPVARAAAAENGIRRELGAVVEAAMRARGMSVRDLARHLDTTLSQAQRLLHHELGGSLTLLTIVRAAQSLDLQLNIRLEETTKGTAGRTERGQ